MDSNLTDDLVLTPVHDEVGKTATAEGTLHNTCDIRNCKAEFASLDAINQNINLGFIKLQVNIGILESLVISGLFKEFRDDLF